MKQVDIKEPIRIIGYGITTTNDNGQSAKDVPAQWQKVKEQNLLDKIPNPQSQDIYAIYTNYENEGVNCDGTYTSIVGLPVNSLDIVPEGFMAITIPAGTYGVFPVAGDGRNVGKQWQEIWKQGDAIPRVFTIDFDRYLDNGPIEIFLSIKK